MRKHAMVRHGALASLLAVVAISGCLDNGGRDTRTAPEAWQAVEDWRTLLHGVSERQGFPDDAIEEHHRIPLRDGVELDAWILRPDVDVPVATVIQVTPYWGGGPISQCLSVPGIDGVRCLNEQRHLLDRGYAIGLVSVRGTGNSEGCFTNTGPDEAQDNAEAIEYIAALPWSNGHIGQAGLSYVGTTTNDVWAWGTPSLKAVMPMAGISQMYEYLYLNGVHLNVQGIVSFNTYYWAVVGLGPVGIQGGVQLRDPGNVPGAVAGEACSDQIEHQVSGQAAVIEPAYTAHWEARDFNLEVAASPDTQRAPVMLVHGVNDWNVKLQHLDPWIETIRSTGVPFYQVYGPWGHVPPEGDDWELLATAWWDHWLLGKDTGIDGLPGAFVSDVDGAWRLESTWPAADAVIVLGVHEGGALDASPGGTAVFQDEGGRDGTFVVFESAPVEEDVHVSGIATLVLNATASGPRANVVASVGHGSAASFTPMTYAAQSLNTNDDRTRFQQDVTGDTKRLAMRFTPMEWVVPAGERIVVAIGYDNAEGGRDPSLEPIASVHDVTLDLADAWLTLPVDRTVTPIEEPVFCIGYCAGDV